MPKAKKGVTYKGKKVYGIVATRVRRKRAAAKRKRGMRGNPARPKGWGAKKKGGLLAAQRKARKGRKRPKTRGKGVSAATKKRRAAAKKRYAKDPKRVAAGKKAAATKRRLALAKSRAGKKGATTRKKSAAAKKRTSTSRKTTTKRKPAKRKVAAKTVRRRKTTVAKRKSKPTKASRRRVALKGLRRSKKRGRTKAIKTYRRKRKTLKRGLKRKFTSRKRNRRVAKSVRKARRAINYNKAHGSTASRSFMTRYKMRSNVQGGVVDAVKKAIPVAAAMYGGRVLARKVLPMVPGLSGLGKHAAPVGSGLMLLAGSFATKKVALLRKHRQEVLMGLGLNFIEIVLTSYVPSNWLGAIGLSGDESIYDSAMGEYVDVGEYIDTGGYEEEMGEYIEMGAEEELGMMEEMGEGFEEALGGGGIGTGIGTQNSAMLKSVPRRAMTAAVPSRSFVRQVPKVGAGYDKLANLYTGIFSGGF